MHIFTTDDSKMKSRLLRALLPLLTSHVKIYIEIELEECGCRLIVEAVAGYN